MSRNTALVDAGIAAALAVLAWIIAPGLAVVALIALVVLLVGGLSVAVDRRRGRARRRRY